MRNTYFGFTNNLKPMQAAKVEKSLDKLTRFDDSKVGPNKEFTYLKLKEGCKPEYEENYRYYSARIEDYTKPKTLYKLTQPNGSTFYEINKTLHDYAVYLIENDFLDEQKAATFIEQEKREKEEEERIEAEKRQKEREEKQKKKEIEDQKKKEEVEKKQKLWFETGEKLLQEFEINPITSVLDRHWEELIELHEDFSTYKQKMYNDLVKKLTMTVGNQKLCIHQLQYYVECENDENRKFTLKRNFSMFLEKEVLFETFQPLLSDKPVTITAKVKAVFAGRVYKGSKPTNLETFFYYNGENFIECEAQPIKLEGISFFILEGEKGWSLFEARSGRGTLSNHTKTELLEKAKQSIKKQKERLLSNVEYAISQSGLSPKYLTKEREVDIKFDNEGQGVLF
jgi:hypothetical protein